MSKILLVDDDSVFRELLHEALVCHDHQVECAQDGEAALEVLGRFVPDIILLDLMMPRLDGFGLLAAREQHTPVIVISAIDNEAERIRGYELGADDFLTKPFSIKELLVRMNAIQRRVELAQHQVKHQDQAIHSDSPDKQVAFDETRYSVAIGEQQVVLTQTEFKLMKYLFENKGKVVTKQELQRSVLQKDLGRFDRNLDMHISNTRRKLAQTALPRTLINTVRGQGYSFSTW